MTSTEKEIAALERQLYEAKKRLESEQTKQNDQSRRAREENEAHERHRLREERKEKEAQAAKRRQASEEEESMRMLEQLALSEMKLTAVKRAKDAVGNIYKQKLAEVDTISQILTSRERKYKLLLEGHTGTTADDDSQLMDVFQDCGSDESNVLAEERKQIMKELLNRRQEELDAALDRYKVDAEALQERKRVELERLAQYRYNHGLSFADTTLDSDVATRVRQTEEDVPRTRLRVEQLRRELEKSYQQARGQAYKYSGELGPSSYQPWQLEDYYMILSIVVDIVDCVIRDTSTVSWSEGIDIHTQELLWETEKRKLESEMNVHNLMREARIAAGSITDAVIESECNAIASDFMELCHSSDKFVTSLIVTSIQDICATHSEHNPLVKSSHAEMKKTRRRTRDVYRHTQLSFVKLGGTQSTETQQIAHFDDEEDDVVVLDFLRLPPIHLSHKELSEGEQQYKHAEAKYWQGLDPSVSLFHLPDIVKVVSSSAVDSSERFIALGGDNGVIVVMDLCYSPPLPVRVHSSRSTDRASVVELSWSLDSSRLLSLHSKGIVQLWSMSGSYGSNTRKEMSDFTHSAAKGYFPCPLKNLLTLRPNDFVFVEGPFAGSGASNVPAPTQLVFHPAVTLVGTQNWFVVALSGGDILKVNSDESRRLVEIRYKRLNTDMSASRIGQNLEAELFRGHRHSVSSIGFVRHTAQMVSVDLKAHVFIWNYERSSQTGYGWFIPTRKYRVDMAEQVYKPAFGHPAKTLFSDTKQLAGRRKQTVQQRERARQSVKVMIESLTDPPWHVEQDRDFVVKIYAPDEVPAFGEIFHIVTLHHADGELSEYATQMYKPAKSVATQLISARITPSGQDVIFMFLYPAFTPKSPHITVVTLSIESFTFHSTRVDIPISQQQHDECTTNSICSMAISRVFDVSRSDYVGLNVCGKLLAYSLATGSLLLAGGQEPLFVGGCELMGRMGMIPRHAVVHFVHHATRLLLIAASKGSSSLHVLQLEDQNTRTSRCDMWQASNQCNLRILRNCPFQFRARSHHWTTDGSCFVSPEDFARQLLEEVVTLAVKYGDRPAAEPQGDAEQSENVELPGHTDRMSQTRQSDVQERDQQEDGEEAATPSQSQTGSHTRQRSGGDGATRS